MSMKKFTWVSTPMINLMSGLSDAAWKLYYDDVMKMHMVLRPPVESLKQRLGKQAFTWVGEYRYWVWEGDDWRVFASNKQGVSFEVREALDLVRAFNAWDDFRKKAAVE